MLILPFLVGAVRSGGAWVQVPLFVFWLLGYFAFAATGVWIASRRRERDLPPLIVYASLAAVAGVTVAIARPDLLGWTLVFAPCVLTGLWFAWRHEERALVNDGALIVAACLVGLVVYQAGYPPGGTIVRGWIAMGGITLALTAYFFGTSLVVKTVIRERHSAAYRRASVIYHGAWTLLWAVAAALPVVVPGLSHRGHLVLACVFAGLTARAWLVAGRAVRPARLGMFEIGVCVVLFVVSTRVWP